MLNLSNLETATEMMDIANLLIQGSNKALKGEPFTSNIASAFVKLQSLQLEYNESGEE